jgi:hypothetical protein
MSPLHASATCRSAEPDRPSHELASTLDKRIDWIGTDRRFPQAERIFCPDQPAKERGDEVAMELGGEQGCGHPGAKARTGRLPRSIWALARAVGPAPTVTYADLPRVRCSSAYLHIPSILPVGMHAAKH